MAASASQRFAARAATITTPNGAPVARVDSAAHGWYRLAYVKKSYSGFDPPVYV